MVNGQPTKSNNPKALENTIPLSVCMADRNAMLQHTLELDLKITFDQSQPESGIIPIGP